MTGSNYLKAGVTGLIGSLVMFILMQIALKTGMAPFNVPPSSAFLHSIGMPAKPLALIGHFLYGAFWSIILVAIAKASTSLGKGIILSIILWLIMMLIISPIIGWGVFGFGDAAGNAKDSPLYLAPGPKYLIATLVLHLVFGLVVGGINAAWTVKGKARQYSTSS